MSEALEQFKDAMRGRGLVVPSEISTDGKLHRCDVEGRDGEGDGSYLFHPDGPIPAGGCINWKDGKGWENWHKDVGRTLTLEEEERLQERVKIARERYETERERRHVEARNKADEVWRTSAPCPADHPYLACKGVRKHEGLRVATSGPHKGDIVIPLRDPDGTLHSLQFIDGDGEKRYLKGGRVAGCYHLIGEPDNTLCIAEGFATSASIHEATGHAVAVAFSAGNLLEVSTALHGKYPDLELVICADDDHQTKGNPGLTKAKEAAEAVGGKVAVPDFGPDRPEKATDFNDLTAMKGLQAVRESIERRVNPGEIGTDPEASIAAASRSTAKPWTVGDMKRMLGETPPSVPWLVQGLIPAGVVGIMAGRASVGKSSTALLIGMGLAAGLNVLGREVSQEARRGVVYVSLEDDRDEIHRRVQRASSLLAEDRDWTDAHMESLIQRFIPLFPNRASGAVFSLEARWREIADKANAIPGGCALIVLDTLARLSWGEESSSRDMRPFMEAMAALCDATGATVMAVHHVGKGHDTNSDRKLCDRLHPEALRGSSAIEGAARFVIQLASLSPAEAEEVGLDVGEASKGAYVVLAPTKISSAQRGDMVLLERRREGEPGAGFLYPHPDSRQKMAALAGQTTVLKLRRGDEVLLAIAEAGNLGSMDKTSEASRIWPNSPNPKGQWDKQVSALRNAGFLKGDLLTKAGWAEAERLGFQPSDRKTSSFENCNSCLINKSLPSGREEVEEPEGIPSFHSVPLGEWNGRKENGGEVQQGVHSLANPMNKDLDSDTATVDAWDPHAPVRV